MNCDAFERDLPDWLMEHLPPREAQAMRAHCAACPLCQQKTQEERFLRRQWQALPAPVPVPEIWPRLSSRVAAVSTPRRSFNLPMRAVSGIAVAAGLCLLLARTSLLAPPPAESPGLSVSDSEPKNADENSLAQRVAKMRQTPADENDAFLTETQQRHQEQRFALLGKDAP